MEGVGRELVMVYLLVLTLLFFACCCGSSIVELYVYEFGVIHVVIA